MEEKQSLSTENEKLVERLNHAENFDDPRSVDCETNTSLNFIGSIHMSLYFMMEVLCECVLKMEILYV